MNARTLPDDISGIAVEGATVTYRNGHTALHDVGFTIPTPAR